MAKNMFLALDRRTRLLLAHGVGLLKDEMRRNGLVTPKQIDALYDTLTAEDSDGQERTNLDDLDGLLDSDLMTYQEAARYLRISERSVRRRVADGQLEPVRLGGRTVFRRSDLEELK
jgi:excisionase family DNA binding protein